VSKAVLTINAGSSSIKFGVFEVQAARLVLLFKGLLEHSGPAANFIAHFQARHNRHDEIRRARLREVEHSRERAGWPVGRFGGCASG